MLSSPTSRVLGLVRPGKPTTPIHCNGAVSHRSSAVGDERDETAADVTYVSSPEVVVLVRKGRACGLLGVAHDLDGHALGLAVVESQRGAVRPLGHDAHTDADLDILAALARLDVLVGADEGAKPRVDVELVGIGVQIPRGSQVFDLLATKLEVLLEARGQLGDRVGPAPGSRLCRRFDDAVFRRRATKMDR